MTPRGSRPAGNRAAKTSGVGTAVDLEDTRPAAAAIATALVIRGCTCDPDFDTTTVADGVCHVTIAHDDWCPALGGDRDGRLLEEHDEPYIDVTTGDVRI